MFVNVILNKTVIILNLEMIEFLKSFEVKSAHKDNLELQKIKLNKFKEFNNNFKRQFHSLSDSEHSSFEFKATIFPPMVIIPWNELVYFKFNWQLDIESVIVSTCDSSFSEVDISINGMSI